MANFKKFVEEISFKKLVGLSFVLALLLTVPVSVWVVQQETKTVGQAFFEKPKPITPTPAEYGSPPTGQPQINLVWPFLGKTGDVILVEGENFGQNPKDKTLMIGDQLVTQEEINQWTPTLVEFKIPSLPAGSLAEPLTLSVAGQSASWNRPLTIYDLATTLQVKKDGRYLKVAHAPDNIKIEVYFQDGEKISVPVPGAGGIFLREEKPILSLRVLDSHQQPLPFFVEPGEFGF